MMTQLVDQQLFGQKTRRIRMQVSAVLKKWGLIPRFKRWRLTQDPDTGMIVLFGVLNNKYIAAHTAIPFRDYFDPRLLHDLANELQVQVVSCNSDGLRYAFILDRGQLGKLPTHIDFPYIDSDEVMIRVVYGNGLVPVAALPVNVAPVDDQTLVDQGVGAFLKVFDDIKLKDAAEKLLNQNPPRTVLINEDEFNKRIMEHEAMQQRKKRISELFDETDE